ncbi:hypothetical protein Vadar_009731 [Vaccinium darrowii]|uniref:Uncharacterized protein n=1 Tax=Vaccinium darrowii TaxID=229202 RepID=A0ACB7YCP0_9ERIC|nr:hypothetical protein Vadar_009731 [Vaccinium darrowii]
MDCATFLHTACKLEEAKKLFFSGFHHLNSVKRELEREMGRIYWGRTNEKRFRLERRRGITAPTKLCGFSTTRTCLADGKFVTRRKMQTSQAPQARSELDLAELESKYFRLSSRFGLRESLAIISQLVEGVHYIHKAGFVHRDLTRSNIFFDENNIQIGDFGLATFVTDRSHGAAVTGDDGNPLYMVPKLKVEDAQASDKVDIFSLGLVFCDLLYQFITDSERAKMFEIHGKER